MIEYLGIPIIIWGVVILTAILVPFSVYMDCVREPRKRKERLQAKKKMKLTHYDEYKEKYGKENRRF